MQTPLFGGSTTARNTTARQTSSCGTITVTEDDTGNGGNGGDNGGNGGDNGGQPPQNGGGGFPGGTVAAVGGLGALAVVVFLLTQ
jgi:hypothetical protein